jgi:hypothetical protein
MKKNKALIIVGIIAAVILIIALLFKPRIKRKNMPNSTDAVNSGATATDAISIPDLTDIVKDIADAINAFTDNILDFTAQYKGQNINYWVQQLAYLSSDAIRALDNYWNSKYFQSNGSFGVSLLFFELELGGERSLLYALERLQCGIQGFDCNLKDMAIANIKNTLNA